MVRGRFLRKNIGRKESFVSRPLKEFAKLP